MMNEQCWDIPGFATAKTVVSVGIGVNLAAWFIIDVKGHFIWLCLSGCIL